MKLIFPALITRQLKSFFLYSASNFSCSASAIDMIFFRRLLWVGNLNTVTEEDCAMRDFPYLIAVRINSPICEFVAWWSEMPVDPTNFARAVWTSSRGVGGSTLEWTKNDSSWIHLHECSSIDGSFCSRSFRTAKSHRYTCPDLEVIFRWQNKYTWFKCLSWSKPWGGLVAFTLTCSVPERSIWPPV